VFDRFSQLINQSIKIAYKSSRATSRLNSFALKTISKSIQILKVAEKVVKTTNKSTREIVTVQKIAKKRISKWLNSIQNTCRLVDFYELFSTTDNSPAAFSRLTLSHRDTFSHFLVSVCIRCNAYAGIFQEMPLASLGKFVGLKRDWNQAL